MTDDELTAIEKAWLDPSHVGTHWDGCETSHARCAIARLLRETRTASLKLKLANEQLDRIRWMTGRVSHRDDQLEGCDGCGCISATAEECVAEMIRYHTAEVDGLNRQCEMCEGENDRYLAEVQKLSGELADWQRSARQSLAEGQRP